MADPLVVITAQKQFSYSRNPIIIELESDNSDTYILFKIYNYNATELITTLYGKPASDGKIKFDISEVLDTKVFYQLPLLSQSSLVCTEPIYFYKIAAEEWLGDTKLETKWINNQSDTSDSYVLKGGLSQEKLSIDIFSKIKTDKLFLTWADQVFVKQSQPYYIFYLHQYATESLFSYVTIHYTDGTSFSGPLNSISLAFGELYCFGAGFDQRNMGSASTKTPLYYEIYIRNSSEVIRAGKLTFNLSDDYSLYPKHFFYANSLGGYEGLFATGKNQIIPKGDNSEVLQNNSSGGLALQFAHQIEKQGKIAPGFKSKAEIERLNDILLTSETYEIINDSLIKIVIDKKSKLNYVLDENLSPFVINYKRAFLNKNFTPDNVSS